MAIIRRRTRPPVSVRPVAPVGPATVLVRPEVIRCIGLACGNAGDLETGGPLIGTIQRSWDPRGERLIVGVLGTVSPGPGIRAKPSSVALGAQTDGERAASALRCWRSVTRLDLVHLGDWHMHPSGCPEPSSGDVRTARRMHDESGAPVWLTAIAVGSERGDESVETKRHVARLCSAGDSLEIAFYREVGKMELPPVPIRMEEAALPRLPDLPWHVADPMRFAVECRLLDAAGFKTAVSANGTSGLQLRISGNGLAFTARTGSGYPEEEPELVDDRGLRIRHRGWAPDRFLVDLVRGAR